MSYDRRELSNRTVIVLKSIAKKLGILGVSSMIKQDLVDAIAEHKPVVKQRVKNRIEELLDDIRTAHAGGVKVAQVAESDEEVQAAVEEQLDDDEKKRVCWGGSYIGKIH